MGVCVMKLWFVSDSNSTGMGICPPHSECVHDGPGIYNKNTTI